MSITYINKAANNKGTDQTAWVRSLIGTFGVRMRQNILSRSDVA